MLKQDAKKHDYMPRGHMDADMMRMNFIMNMTRLNTAQEMMKPDKESEIDTRTVEGKLSRLKELREQILDKPSLLRLASNYKVFDLPSIAKTTDSKMDPNPTLRRLKNPSAKVRRLDGKPSEPESNAYEWALTPQIDFNIERIKPKHQVVNREMLVYENLKEDALNSDKFQIGFTLGKRIKITTKPAEYSLEQNRARAMIVNILAPDRVEKNERLCSSEVEIRKRIQKDFKRWDIANTPCNIMIQAISDKILEEERWCIAFHNYNSKQPRIALNFGSCFLWMRSVVNNLLLYGDNSKPEILKYSLLSLFNKILLSTDTLDKRETMLIGLSLKDTDEFQRAIECSSGHANIEIVKALIGKSVKEVHNYGGYTLYPMQTGKRHDERVVWYEGTESWLIEGFNSRCHFTITKTSMLDYKTEFIVEYTEIRYAENYIKLLNFCHAFFLAHPLVQSMSALGKQTKEIKKTLYDRIKGLKVYELGVVEKCYPGELKMSATGHISQDEGLNNVVMKQMLPTHLKPKEITNPIITEDLSLVDIEGNIILEWANETVVGSTEFPWVSTVTPNIDSLARLYIGKFNECIKKMNFNDKALERLAKLFNINIRVAKGSDQCGGWAKRYFNSMSEQLPSNVIKEKRQAVNTMVSKMLQVYPLSFRGEGNIGSHCQSYWFGNKKIIIGSREMAAKVEIKNGAILDIKISWQQNEVNKRDSDEVELIMKGYMKTEKKFEIIYNNLPDITPNTGFGISYESEIVFWERRPKKRRFDKLIGTSRFMSKRLKNSSIFEMKLPDQTEFMDLFGESEFGSQNM